MASMSSSSPSARGSVSTAKPSLASRAYASGWMFSSSSALVVTSVRTFHVGTGVRPAGEQG